MKKVVFTFFLLFGALAILFTGCDSAGAGGDSNGDNTGDQTETPGFTDLEVYTIPSGALTSLQAEAQSGDTQTSEAALEAYLLASAANSLMLLPSLYIEIAANSWDPSLPNTYTESGYTVTWDRTGDTWTWQVSDAQATETYLVTVSDVGNQWDVNLNVNGVSLFDGWISDDSLSGEVQIFDLESSVEGGDSIVVSWAPEEDAGTAYTREVIVEVLSGTDVLERLDLLTTTDGSEIEWTLTEPVATL